MCKLCDRIYRVTESSPYPTTHIHIDPEGVFQLMVPWCGITSDADGWLSTSINFCPECGSNVTEQGIITLNNSRKKVPTTPTPPPIREILNGSPK